MDSDTQPNPKPDWKSTAFALLVCAALTGGLAVFSKLTNPQTDVLSFFLILPLVAGLLLLSNVRLKVITILSLVASIVFLVMSFLTKDHNPKLSSISFLNAFIALAVAIVPTLLLRTQTFLYDRGFRGIGFYVSSQDGSGGGGNWSDSGWGGGDCGGDGGGGDCGG
ncbi:MAG: hypothetical protein KME45_11150 [Stenomitos rutilans HA7619-LM2]|jgi:cell division protein FtsW (lipid II flippase)|nr:hypothetical protein [Stenomitos rutilans HA7619-LM2]